MRVLVRSWNVFHGRTVPPGRSAHLEQAVRLVTEDGPDLVCLQEVPVWGLGRLERWSGMAAVTDTTIRAGLGPLPLPLWLTRRLTDIHHGRLRSFVTGQGNAVLVGPRLQVQETWGRVLNDRHFRRALARQERIELRVRLRWAIERRIAQAVRVVTEEGRPLFAVNIHASHVGSERRLADAELARAVAMAQRLAEPGEPIVLAGDFNITGEQSRTLAALVGAGWSPPGPDIDHVLVRGAVAGLLRVWPDHARRVGGRLLSDHPPVELEVEL